MHHKPQLKLMKSTFFFMIWVSIFHILASPNRNNVMAKQQEVTCMNQPMESAVFYVTQCNVKMSDLHFQLYLVV